MNQRDQPELTRRAEQATSFPVSIQPHGALLVCRGDAAMIVCVSANIAEFLERDPSALLGRSLVSVLGAQCVHDLRNALAKAGAPAYGTLSAVRRTPDATPIDIVAHDAGGHLVVEVEFSQRTTDTGSTLEILHALVRRVSRADDTDAIATTTAQLMRATLGFDRVIVCRHVDETVRIIAEAKRGDVQSLIVEPPAPVQVTALDRLSIIADARATPVGLVVDEGDAPHIDLSHTCLLSAPVEECARLLQMRSLASLTIPIVGDDEVWGCIVCHHEAPRAVACSLRPLAQLFSRFVALQIASAERRTSRQALQEAARRLDELVRTFAEGQPLARSLRLALPRLAELIDCDGAVLYVRGEWTAVGSIPARDELGAVLRMLERERIETIWSTHNLQAQHGLVDATRVAAVLAIPLDLSSRSYLFLFRDAGSPRWTDLDRHIADLIKTRLLELERRGLPVD